MERMIVRRLVAGIGLIVWALYSFYRSYTFSSFANKYSTALGRKITDSMIKNSNALIIFSVLILLIGVSFIATCNRKPNKNLDYPIVIIYFIVSAICGAMAGTLAPITKLIAFVAFILLILGLSFKNRLKTNEKEDTRNIDKNSSNITNKSLITDTTEPIKSEKNSNLNDLRDLKKLLDDGVITQEDFDTKKKQILNL